MSTTTCPQCGSTVPLNVECKYCGYKFAASNQFQGAPPPPDQLYDQSAARQHSQFQAQQQGQSYGQPYGQPPYGQPPHGQPPHGQPPYGHPPHGQPPYGQPYGQPYYPNPKNKIVAGLLGIFLGGLGIHKFYLGRIGWGIVYLLFCWTSIPAFVGFIEGIVYLASSDHNFHNKYSR